MANNNFDWAHPDFSVQLLNGELHVASKNTTGSGVLKRGSSSAKGSSKKSDKKSSRRSTNPGGNYNGKYGKGVYKRSVQINPDYYVDDLEEFLDKQGNIKTVKTGVVKDINNYNYEQEKLNKKLALLTGSPIKGEPVSYKDAQELARWYGLPTFRHNNKSYETLFNDGDIVMDLMGYTIGPATNVRQSDKQAQQPRMNYDGMSFNAAFAAARKAGLDKFNWRGKDYTTELANSKWRSGKPRTSSSARTKPATEVPMPTIAPEPMDRVAEGIEPYKDIYGNVMNNPYALHAYPDIKGYGGWLLPI